MKHLLGCLLVASILSIPSIATAEENHHSLGIGLDVGGPDGAALGVVVRPVVSWLRIEPALTYNALAPGGRLGLTLDPTSFFLSPTLTLEGGFATPGHIPGLSNSPDVSYQYANLQAGFDIGSRNSVRFFVHAGPSYIHGDVSNLGPLVNQSDITVGNASVHGFVLPTAKLGFVVLF